MESNKHAAPDDNEMVQLAEEVLRALCIRNASIHSHRKIARIQVGASDFDRAVQMRDTIVDQLKAIGYRFVALDLEEIED